MIFHGILINNEVLLFLLSSPSTVLKINISTQPNPTPKWNKGSVHSHIKHMFFLNQLFSLFVMFKLNKINVFETCRNPRFWLRFVMFQHCHLLYEATVNRMKKCFLKVRLYVLLMDNSISPGGHYVSRVRF